MKHAEHGIPHFHAIYNDYGGIVAIETGEVIKGKLPSKVSTLVKEWRNFIGKNSWKIGD